MQFVQSSIKYADPCSCTPSLTDTEKSRRGTSSAGLGGLRQTGKSFTE